MSPFPFPCLILPFVSGTFANCELGRKTAGQAVPSENPRAENLGVRRASIHNGRQYIGSSFSMWRLELYLWGQDRWDELHELMVLCIAMVDAWLFYAREREGKEILA